MAGNGATRVLQARLFIGLSNVAITGILDRLSLPVDREARCNSLAFSLGARMKYLSIAECYEEQALRHLSNALKHEANGHPDYAIGSRRKAAKWRAKAAESVRFTQLPEPLERMTTLYADKIAAAIMNGN